MQQLSNNGISTGIHYPEPLPFLPAYRHLNHLPSDYPVAWDQHTTLLSLPVCADMTDEQVVYVINTLKECAEHYPNNEFLVFHGSWLEIIYPNLF
jgi:dTDP-4-amino-4,6-dideoxygalactose transaminase